MMQRQLRKISSSCQSCPASSRATIVTSTPTTISTRTTSASTSPTLLSIFIWSMALLLVSSCLGFADAGILAGHPISKRSFFDLQCKGNFDASIFAKLDRICDDCYNLYREPRIYVACKDDCFASEYFKGCLDVLLMQNETEKIKTYIKQLHGFVPDI